MSVKGRIYFSASKPPKAVKSDIETVIGVAMPLVDGDDGVHFTYHAKVCGLLLSLESIYADKPNRFVVYVMKINDLLNDFRGKPFDHDATGHFTDLSGHIKNIIHCAGYTCFHSREEVDRYLDPA